MKRISLMLTAALAACLFWSFASAAPTATAPTTAPATTAATTQPATRPAPDAADLRSAAIAKALAGQFNAALELLDEAAKLAPADKATTAAKGMLQEYLEHLDEFESQRLAEYEEAVRRVKRSMLAHEWLGGPDAAKIGKKLREKVEAAVAAWNKAAEKASSYESGVADVQELRGRAKTDLKEAAVLRRQLATLKEADGSQELIKQTEQQIAALEKEAKEAADKAESLEKQAAAQKTESLGDLDAAAERLNEARAVLDDQAGRYAETILELSASALKMLSQYRADWSSYKAGDSDESRRQWDDLKAAEEKLAEALADVSAMAEEKPWRLALFQAAVAKRLASPADKATEQDWYRKLVATAEAYGEKAIAEARWRDALEAYAGLQDLEEDNETYLNKAKTVRKHVRVMALYGRGAGASSQPAEEGPEAWRELVEGVDAEMVQSAISQLDLFYVSTVDYGKVAKAALSNLQILAETPQAAGSFEGLSDKEKKQDFIDAIARQAETVDKRQRVDHMDLLLALNAALRASERSVKIPAEVIAVEFTEGLLGELDKFSSMVWPHDVPDFNKNTMGQFYGVGIQITKEEGEPLKVVSPLADSPALDAGIRAGDAIIAVDGTPTKDQNINKLVSMIMGERGTKVVLTVRRPGRPTPIDFEVIRQRINIRTVKGWRRESGGKWRYLVDGQGEIAYVQVTQFTESTPEEITDALEDIKQELDERGKQHLDSLILDLRFNPGGLLKAAVGVANEFLRTGLIVATRGRQRGSDDIHADDTGSYLAGNLVVLVNEQSASAAEIVSGALKDWKRGIIVGGRTYGKGSVQNVIPIRRRRALLKLTTAYYYLPSGRLLHRENGSDEWGVDPDIEINFTPKQTKRWLEIRRKTGLLLTDELPKTLDEDLKKQFDDDIQLQTAVLILKLMKLQGARPAA